jgi:hypothetical protein
MTDIDEYNGKASIYPNPTDGNLNIEAEGMRRITVVNTIGQVVYDTEVETDHYLLNLSRFGSGLYMIRVYTTEGMMNRPVTVTR